MAGFIILLMLSILTGLAAGLLFFESQQRETIVLAEQILMMTLGIISAVFLSGALVCGYLGDLIRAARRKG